MDDQQARRIAVNESRFRELNERIAGAIEEFHATDGGQRLELMCECAIASCEQMIEVSADEYRHIRSDPAWFAVRPDHVVLAAETPVAQHDGYWIVEKRGLGRDVAERLAPPAR